MFILKYINNDLLVKINNKKFKFIKKRINKVLDYKKISIDFKICNENIKDNLQFIKINNKKYFCSTRNIIDTFYLKRVLVENIDDSKKHTIINKSITDTKFRNIIFFGTAIINVLSAIALKKYSDIDFSLLFNTINICNISYFGASSIEQCIENVITRDQNFEVFNNMEDIYQEFINRFCLLTYSLNLTSPIEIMALYSIMYDNNLLSFKKTNRKDIISELDILLIDNLGYKVLLGENSVCRNHSTLFRDICLRMGYSAKIVVGTQKDKDNKILGDHAIVEVKYDNKYIYIDPFNYEVLNFDEDKRLYSNFDGKTYLDNIDYSFVNKLGMKLSGFNVIKYKENVVSIDKWKYEYKNTLEKLIVFDNYWKLDKFRYDNNKLLKEFYELSDILDTSNVKKFYKKLNI